MVKILRLFKKRKKRQKNICPFYSAESGALIRNIVAILLDLDIRIDHLFDRFLDEK
jgi:hypothetical protein